MAMCLLFVVAALGEFVIVKVIYSMTQDAKALAEVGKTPQANLNDPLGNLIDPPPVQSRRIPSGFNAQVNQVDLYFTAVRRFLANFRPFV